MNWVDAIILGTLGLSVLTGVWRGAVKTVLSVAGVVLGFVVATRESGAVGMVLERWMSAEVATAAGFVFVFLGIATAFGLTAWLVRRVLQGLFLGWLDQLLGGALGFLRAAVLLGVLALVVEGLGSFEEANKSLTYPFALGAGRFLIDLVPEETRKRLNWDELQERWDRLPDSVKDVI